MAPSLTRFNRCFRDMGSWLTVNVRHFKARGSGSVYGEGPTKVAAGLFHDTDTAAYPPRISASLQGYDLYAIELGWPTGSEAIIHSLGTVVGARKIASVALLGSDAELHFDKTLMLCAFGFQRRHPGSMPTYSV